MNSTQTAGRYQVVKGRNCWNIVDTQTGLMSRSGLSTKSGAQQIASSMRPEDEHISGWKERGEPFPPYAGVDEMFGDEDRP